MKKILIVAGGEDFAEKKFLAEYQSSDFLLAADSGLDKLAALKIKPDLFIGDADSVNNESLALFADLEKMIYPSAKDYSDLELCMQYAVKNFIPCRICIFGVWGSYVDHSLAALLDLQKYRMNQVEMELITNNSKITVLQKSALIPGKKGRRFSVFALGETVKDFEMEGALYSFGEVTDLGGPVYSLSNVFSEEVLSLKFKSGHLWLILFDDGYR